MLNGIHLLFSYNCNLHVDHCLLAFNKIPKPTHSHYMILKKLLMTRHSIYSFIIFLVLLSLSSCNSSRSRLQRSDLEQMVPREYQKNKNTDQKVQITNKTYGLHFKFSSPSNEWYEWKWMYKRKETDEKIKKFGVPEAIFQPFQVTRKNVRSRNKIIEAGLYRQKGNVVFPDFNRMVPYYMSFTAPLYALTIKTLGKQSTPRERVEFLLRFVQDIPYGIPPKISNNRVISGLLTPPQIFIEKWGDCDSKVLLLSSILAHEPRYKILLVHLKNHLLMGFEGRPHPGDSWIVHEGRKYILAEPTGPAHLPLGKTGSDYNGKFENVEALEVSESDRRVPHYISKKIFVNKL